MIIEQLTIYPIKGLGGINVQSAQALQKGFKNDRRYMLVDPEGQFMSQRGIQEMALFRPSIVDNQLTVQYNNESIHLNLNQDEGLNMNTTVWDHSVKAIQVSKEANEWFSDQLGKSCRLVKMNKDSERIQNMKTTSESTEVSFADGYPYLILGTASLDQLNTKLEKPVKIDRFRANIIVNTSIPHIEDELGKYKLSGLDFLLDKLCARCQVVTIDQQNAEKSKEPLKTLAEYRKKLNKVYFGMNAVCLEEGVISVGDKLIKKDH